MIVVKNINNNVSLCKDSQGREVIAFGKGIGFTKPPYSIPLEKIERTFYDVDETYLSVIADIPESIIRVTAKIVDQANRKLGNRYYAKVVITLADHIQFAIKREKENINIKLPLLYEIQHLYPKEMEIGCYALEQIKKCLGVELCKEEAASIVLHLVDYDLKKNTESADEEAVIDKCRRIVEVRMNTSIDKEGFNYYRFVQHIHYLLERTKNNKNYSVENGEMFQKMKKEYPKIYKCALEIEKVLKIELNDEEMLYLILHINRLCAREDCDQ